MDPMIELKAAFLEECDELLGALEQRLTALMGGSVSTEDVNGAFRAIHSVKGGAGAFGFSTLVELTHVFEAALDHLRAGRVALPDAPYDLFLQALDQVSSMVSAARRGETLDAPQDLVHALQKVGVKTDAQVSSAPVVTQASAPVIQKAAEKPVPEGPSCLRIHLNPQTDLFNRAVDLRQVFASLEAFGTLTVAPDLSSLPGLASLNPMSCHLRVSAELSTAASPQSVSEILELYLDTAEFKIESEVKNGTPSEGGGSTRTQDVHNESRQSEAPEQVAASSVVVNKAPLPQTVGSPLPSQKERAKAVGSIRVDLDRIDRLMNLVGEIVITQSMLDQRLLSLPVSETMQIADGLQVLGRQTRELQESVMAVRAQPVKNVFQRMPRLVRELAQTLGKQARLVVIGEDTEVDKTIIEELADPLTHMIRNAMDHGMEMPEERASAGKPAEGVVTLQAEQRSGRIVISVADDGRGINREKLLAKARSRGLVAPTERPAPEEIDALLFHPGLSTVETVTDVSGRGVGMDVVKQNVEALGGRVLINSEFGRGTRFTLLLPLTLAVMDGMIIRCCGHRLVLPIASIRETLQACDTPVERLPGGQEFLRLRNKLSPLIRLGEVLGLGRSDDEQIIVMTETDRGNHIGLLVDEIIGQQQVVVKSLEANYGMVPGTSAATILGDGLVALIIDVDAIPQLCAPPQHHIIPPATQQFSAAIH